MEQSCEYGVSDTVRDSMRDRSRGSSKDTEKVPTSVEARWDIAQWQSSVQTLPRLSNVTVVMHVYMGTSVH